MLKTLLGITMSCHTVPLRQLVISCWSRHNIHCHYRESDLAGGLVRVLCTLMMVQVHGYYKVQAVCWCHGLVKAQGHGRYTVYVLVS